MNTPYEASYEKRFSDDSCIIGMIKGFRIFPDGKSVFRFVFIAINKPGQASCGNSV